MRRALDVGIGAVGRRFGRGRKRWHEPLVDERVRQLLAAERQKPEDVRAFVRKRERHEGGLSIGLKLAEIHDQSIEFVRARYLEQLNRLQLPKEGARLPVEVSSISGLRRI